jgi:N-acetylglucosaminyldiphosphoundecaprenol N-acetyl-beta-D-mannosaminyltransferase
MRPQTAPVDVFLAATQAATESAALVPSALEVLPGIRVHRVGLMGLNELVAHACAHNRKQIIANHNLHSVYLYYHDFKMRSFYEIANYTHVDGMGVVLLARLLGVPLTRQHRTTFVDWFESLFRMAAERGWRVFYLGSKPGVAARGAALLQRRFPALRINYGQGYFDTRPDSAENFTVLERIRDFQPHVLMVGMGMPRQERWIFENYHAIQANVILPVGAAIDYVAGAIPTPPRWAARIGLEWLFRLLGEPRRLWARYLLEPWFVLRIAAAVRLKKPFRIGNVSALSVPEHSEGGVET